MKPERFVCAFDLHGDHGHKPTVQAFHDFCKDFKPDARIVGGDIFDLRWLRRSASEDEKLEQVTADFQNGCAFLEKFRPSVFLWGNHDERLRDALDSNAAHGSLKAMAEQWIGHIEDLTPKCQHFPYDKRRGVYQYGDYKILHGYAHGIGAARKHALTYGNCIMGHVHRHDTVTVEGHERRTCHVSGCLCVLDMGYNRATVGTLAQERGWVYGWKTKEGRLIVQHAREVGGRWFAPIECWERAGST